MKLGPLIFFNCESTCDLTDVPASIDDIKIDARPLDTTNDMQSLGKDQFGASGTGELSLVHVEIYNPF